MQTIHGAAIHSTAGPGPITAFSGAPVNGVLYVSAAGLVAVNTYVSLNPGVAGLVLSDVAGISRYVRFRTGANSRWQVMANSTAETGANAGSDFPIQAFNDAGGFIDTALVIARVAGGTIAWNVARPMTMGALTATSVIHADAAAFIRTSVAQPDGAGVGAGTLLTAPVAGNPTKWMPIIDAGVTRYIPAW